MRRVRRTTDRPGGSRSTLTTRRRTPTTFRTWPRRLSERGGFTRLRPGCFCRGGRPSSTVGDSRTRARRRRTGPRRRRRRRRHWEGHARTLPRRWTRPLDAWRGYTPSTRTLPRRGGTSSWRARCRRRCRRAAPGRGSPPRRGSRRRVGFYRPRRNPSRSTGCPPRRGPRRSRRRSRRSVRRRRRSPRRRKRTGPRTTRRTRSVGSRSTRAAAGRANPRALGVSDSPRKPRRRLRRVPPESFRRLPAKPSRPSPRTRCAALAACSKTTPRSFDSSRGRGNEGTGRAAGAFSRRRPVRTSPSPPTRFAGRGSRWAMNTTARQHQPARRITRRKMSPPAEATWEGLSSRRRPGRRSRRPRRR